MAIKLVDKSARFEIVSQFDESLDLQAEDKSFLKYMDTLNLADLKLKDGAEPPTLFVARCLTDKEKSDIQERHIKVDPVTKEAAFKNQREYFIEWFQLAIDGIKNPDGSIRKVTADELGDLHATSLGVTASNMTTLGKHLKKL